MTRDDLDVRIAQTAGAFRVYCQERSYFVTGDGRVSEAVAAELLGLARETLRKRRLANDKRYVPRHFRLTNEATYRLEDLARFVESRARAGQF